LALKYVNAMVEHGIITGYENGSFRPNKKITRAKLVSVIMRAYGNLGKNKF